MKKILVILIFIPIIINSMQLTKKFLLKNIFLFGKGYHDMAKKNFKDIFIPKNFDIKKGNINKYFVNSFNYFDLLQRSHYPDLLEPLTFLMALNDLRVYEKLQNTTKFFIYDYLISSISDYFFIKNEFKLNNGINYNIKKFKSAIIANIILPGSGNITYNKNYFIGTYVILSYFYTIYNFLDKKDLYYIYYFAFHYMLSWWNIFEARGIYKNTIGRYLKNFSFYKKKGKLYVYYKFEF